MGVEILSKEGCQYCDMAVDLCKEYNLENKKIIRQKRHSFDMSTEYDFLFNYFYGHYKDHIDKFLGTTDEKTVD